MRQKLVYLLRNSIILLPILCFNPSTAYAQATGQITGLITDSSGGVIPNTTIEITNDANGQRRSVQSGPDGFYTVPLVNPGVEPIAALVK